MKFIVALALFALTACAPTSPPPTAILAPSPFPANTGAIFAGEKARELVGQCSRISPGPVEGTWTPTNADIAALEPALATLLEERLHSLWPNAQVSALDYYRQYGGLVIGGKRIIYVDGAHSRIAMQAAPPRNPGSTWRDLAFQVCDGGPIVFGVEYDPATRTFARFAFNGAI